MSKLMPSADFFGNGQRDRLRWLVEKIPGMVPTTSHRWQWSFQGYVAEVNVEPGDTIRILLDVPNPPQQNVALTVNRDLPGNLRFAQRARRFALLADTQLDGEMHLPRSFDAVKSGLLLALAGRQCEKSPQPLAAEDVQSAIDACQWPEDQVVQLENAWEFRPRLHGDATPVQVAVDGDQLRLFRTVVSNFGSAIEQEAVADQALRFNDQLRHARLAVAGDALVAEARLHGEQLTPTWLEAASRAVAVAGLFTEEVLNILADNGEIAEFFTAMFNSVEKRDD